MLSYFWYYVHWVVNARALQATRSSKDFNPFLGNALILYPLKTLQNLSLLRKVATLIIVAARIIYPLQRRRTQQKIYNGAFLRK